MTVVANVDLNFFKKEKVKFDWADFKILIPLYFANFALVWQVVYLRVNEIEILVSCYF